MPTYVFACVANAGRSQMAAAFFNHLVAPGSADAVSAGTKPAASVHPEVLSAMKEVGIDLSNAVPRKLTKEVAEGATLLVNMGCGAACATPLLCTTAVNLYQHLRLPNRRGGS